MLDAHADRFLGGVAVHREAAVGTDLSVQDAARSQAALDSGSRRIAVANHAGKRRGRRNDGGVGHASQRHAVERDIGVFHADQIHEPAAHRPTRVLFPAFAQLDRQPRTEESIASHQRVCDHPNARALESLREMFGQTRRSGTRAEVVAEDMNHAVVQHQADRQRPLRRRIAREHDVEHLGVGDRGKSIGPPHEPGLIRSRLTHGPIDRDRTSATLAQIHSVVLDVAFASIEADAVEKAHDGPRRLGEGGGNELGLRLRYLRDRESRHRNGDFRGRTPPSQQTRFPGRKETCRDQDRDAERNAEQHRPANAHRPLRRGLREHGISWPEPTIGESRIPCRRPGPSAASRSSLADRRSDSSHRAPPAASRGRSARRRSRSRAARRFRPRSCRSAR